MDSIMGVAGFTGSTGRSFNFHSTDPIISTLSTLAYDSLDVHLGDCTDAHRWIDSFFEKLDLKGTSSRSASRPAMSELMKTPGRRRVVGNNSTNHSTPSLQAAAKKDPLATLLFPGAPTADKENRIRSPPPSTATPKRAVSSGSKSSSGIPLSPMRIGSPRPLVSAPGRTSNNSSKQLSLRSEVAEPAPVVVRDFASDPAPVKTLSQLQEEIDNDERGDLSNVLEEDEEEEEGDEGAVPETGESVDAVEGEVGEKGELSMIGEEEEEEDDAEPEDKHGNHDEEEEVQPRPDRAKGLTESASLVIPETQISAEASVTASPVQPVRKVAALPASLPVPTFSPTARSVSGASSVAPDADDDESVPLNDGPSTLRSNSMETSLSSSLPASSTTRTPGSTSRFSAFGSHSAAKIGMGMGLSTVSLGSSPPPVPSATFAGPSHNFRVSHGGGTQQLNFVGLPKKSMGLSLASRNWSTTNSSISDSQGSSSQGGRLSFATAVASSAPDAAGNATTATGATKRKSLTGPDLSAKAAKTSRGSEVIGSGGAGDQPLSKIEQIRGRLQTLNARNSVAAGSHIRMSTVGAFNTNLLPATAASKPLAGAATTPFSSKATLPSSTSTAAILSHPIDAATATTAPTTTGGIVRRPSVMERVKSFENASTAQDHLNPPSPSKIPSAFTRPVSPSPLNSPRGLASPTVAAPASPRPLTRSATSGLPLSSFASPKLASSSSFSPMLGSPKAIPSSFFRSPPAVAAAGPNVAAAPNPTSTAALRAPPPAPIPAPATLPLAAVSPSRTRTIPRSTTPPGSPPAVHSFQSIFQRFTTHQEPRAVPSPPVAEKRQKQANNVISDDEEEADEDGNEDDYGQDELDEAEDDEVPSIRAVEPSKPSSVSTNARERAERAEAKAIAERAREIDEEEAERKRLQQLSKNRLPSLPKPLPLTRDEDSADDESEAEEEGEDEEDMARGERRMDGSTRTIVKKATFENLQTRTSPSKIVMPGTFGAALVAAASSTQNSPHVSEDEDGEDEEDDDRTTRSNTGALVSVQGATGAFKPTKPRNVQNKRSTSSLASSVSSATLSLNQSVGAGATKKATAAAKAKHAQTAAAAAKKEKEDAERKKAMRDLQERRLQAQKKKQELEQKKQETERRAKAEELERKRREREEAVAKAKASAARIAAKREAEEENSKKRKLEQETKVPLKKPATQSSRPMTNSSSSHRISSLAQSQGRPAPNTSANPLTKSGGANSMIGQKFMSNQIRLPDSSSSRPVAAGPSTTVPKPFGLSASQGASRPPVALQGSALRPPPPPASAHKPDPEPYQELPEIDSEYSDSDDEAHEKKVAAFPRWAQSPVLTHQLLEQQKINPDDIFGPIPALSIADMFRNSQSTARLRVRTSSAQWDGTDALTRTDMERYHKAMGFTKTATTSAAQSSSARESEASRQ